MNSETPGQKAPKSKKKTKKSVDPSKLTPEYIEEQRRLRNEKKQKKLLEQGETKQKDEFIKRPMLGVSTEETVIEGLPIKILT